MSKTHSWPSLPPLRDSSGASARQEKLLVPFMFSALFPDRPPRCSSQEQSLALFILTPVKGARVSLSLFRCSALRTEQELSPRALGTQEVRREKVTAGICHGKVRGQIGLAPIAVPVTASLSWEHDPFRASGVRFLTV